jgi:hypothetical protein
MEIVVDLNVYEIGRPGVSVPEVDDGVDLGPAHFGLVQNAGEANITTLGLPLNSASATDNS